jgi:hypothetical protein
MELTSTVHCTTRVLATLHEDGELALKVVGHAEYAPGRTTSAEVVDLPAEISDPVKAALMAALEAGAVALGPRIARAIAKSAEVSAAHGEI